MALVTPAATSKRYSSRLFIVNLLTKVKYCPRKIDPFSLSLQYFFAFPDYKKISKSGPQLMNYDKDWKPIEENYFSKNSMKSESILPPSLSCFSLKEVLIIRNWIGYAKVIGDSSAKLLNQDGLVSQRVYEIAKSRLETHVWRALISVV